MTTKDVDKTLHVLEESAGDELSFLASVGAEFYPTRQLHRLLGQWEVKNRMFHQLHRILVMTAGFSPIWLFGGFAFFLLRLPALGVLFFTLFSASLLVFFTGLLFLRHNFKGKGHLDAIGEMILCELEKRLIAE
jgi:hypothetical protein